MHTYIYIQIEYNPQTQLLKAKLVQQVISVLHNKMESSELLFKNVLTEKSESNKMKEKKRKEGKYYLKSNPFVLPFDCGIFLTKNILIKFCLSCSFMIVVCTFNLKHCPFWSKYCSITYRKENQMVLTFKHLTVVGSSHS